MRRIVALLITVVAAGVTWASDCPPIKIKGPCPKQVECTNLKDVKCAPCAACPSCPTPNMVCPSCPTLPAPIIREIPGPSIYVPVMRFYHWFSPVTVMWKQDSKGEFGFHDVERFNPRGEIQHGDSFGLAVGLGYEWSSRWAISGQVSRWTDPNDSFQWRVRDGTSYNYDVDDGRWGVNVTVNIPW